MKQNCLKIRWINYAGYEIILPNGKVVLIDPSLVFHQSEEVRKPLAEAFYTHGADYIIISHVHGDHVNDIPTILEKYNPKIICSAQSAYYLMERYNIPTGNMYPVYPNETIEIDGMRLQTFHGKHKILAPNPNAKFECELDRRLQALGSIDYMDYCLTTKENVSMFISGGGLPELAFQNIDKDLMETRPNILFRQTTSKWTPEEFAHQLDKWHAQIVFPIHQDGLAKASGMSLEEYFDRTNKELERINSGTRVCNADRNDKWFTIDTCVTISE